MADGKMTRGKMLAVGGGVAGVALAGGATALASPRADHDVVGSWHSVVTFTSPPGLGSIDSLLTLGDDGTAVESRRLYIPFTPFFGPLIGTTGHGSWEKGHRRHIDVAFVAIVQQAPPSATGNIVGIDNVALGIDYDHHSDTISGTFLSNLKDPSGTTVLFTIVGTLTGTRISP
jgi:hypothetical protein